MEIVQQDMEKTNFLCYTDLMIEYKETRHTLQQKQISDLSLYSAGYEACTPGYHYGPVYRAYQLIHFILSGKGALEIDGHTFQLGAGDAFLIPSGKIAYYAADTADPWCYTWISFLGINSQMYFYQLIASSPEPYILHGLDTEKYRALIAQVLALEGTATARYFKGNGILLQVLGELFQDAGFDESCWGKNSVADEAKFYLDVNYSEKLKLKDVAHNFGVHPNYLTRVFHEKYHVTPKQYLLSLKLQKACQLLRTTDLSIAVIAGSMGFDDAMAFSKLFKRSYGYAPSEYRKIERSTE